MSCVFGGIHLRQHADTELVFAHAGLDTGVIAQPFKKALRARRSREVAEWEDGLESVRSLFLGFLPIVVAVWGHRFRGSTRRTKIGTGRRKGGELSGRWRKKNYLL